MPVAGKTVLDIGCWDGAYSIEASNAARCARACWRTDHSARARRSRRPAILRSGPPNIWLPDVEVMRHRCSRPVGRHRGSVSTSYYFCGVFYFICRHPFEALERISKIATECLVLETRLIGYFTRRPFMRFYPGRRIIRRSDQLVGAEPKPCVEAMLRDVGFKRIDGHASGLSPAARHLHAWRLRDSDRIHVTATRS